MKPNFFIIGASKSGTTSLYKYLRKHPEVFLPEIKELHFFSYNELKNRANGIGDAEVINHICKDEHQYQDYYRNSSNFKAIGDVSPSYLFNYSAADKIFEACGKVKILIILRNPADKGYSQYLHLRRNGREKLSFKEALLQEPTRTKEGWNDLWLYKSSGRYYDMVKRYIDVFGRNNVKIIWFENFKKDTEIEMKEVCSFLKINSDVNMDIEQVHNKGGGVYRFGGIGLFLFNNKTIRKIFDCFFPNNINYIVLNLIKKFVVKSKDGLDPNIREEILSELKSDIIKLENLVEQKSNWI